jgi:hypothetical protein
VSVCVSPAIIARQLLGKHVSEATNTHEAIKDILDSFSPQCDPCYIKGKYAINPSQNLLLFLLYYPNSSLYLYIDKEFLNFCNETNNYKYLHFLVCNYYYTRHAPLLLQRLGYMQFSFF